MTLVPPARFAPPPWGDLATHAVAARRAAAHRPVMAGCAAEAPPWASDVSGAYGLARSTVTDSAFGSDATAASFEAFCMDMLPSLGGGADDLALVAPLTLPQLPHKAAELLATGGEVHMPPTANSWRCIQRSHPPECRRCVADAPCA